MSGASSAFYAAEISLLRSETYCVLSAFTLLSFEWMITLDREARLIWRRKVTGATVLFVMNRYWLFLEYITQMVSMYPLSDLGCDAVGYMVIVGNAGPPYIWAAFSTLRAYALSKRKWWVAPLTFVWFVPHLVMESIYYSHLKPLEAPSPINCTLASSMSQSQWIHRTCAIIGDLVVLLITWYSTFGIRRITTDMQGQTSLTDALLKDGTLYFVCLLILNLLNIFINVYPKSTAVTAFQDPITSILVSRFLLNLRDVSDSQPDNVTMPSFVRRSQVETTSLSFSEFIDPMGVELRYNTSEASSTDWSEAPEESELQSFAASRTLTGSGADKSVEPVSPPPVQRLSS